MLIEIAMDGVPLVMITFENTGGEEALATMSTIMTKKDGTKGGVPPRLILAGDPGTDGRTTSCRDLKERKIGPALLRTLHTEPVEVVDDAGALIPADLAIPLLKRNSVGTTMRTRVLVTFT